MDAGYDRQQQIICTDLLLDVAVILDALRRRKTGRQQWLASY